MKITSELIELREKFFAQNSLASENCFLDFLAWNKKYSFEISKINNSILIEVKRNNAFRFPLSENDEELKNTISELIENQNNKEKKSLVFERITFAQKQFLENNFPSKFSFEELRGDADYIYNIDDLAFLKGRKFSKKRNHLNCFHSLYKNFSVQKIDEKNAPEVINFVNDWFSKKVELVKNGDADFDLENLQFEKDGIIETILQISEIGTEKIAADAIAIYIEESCSNIENSEQNPVNLNKKLVAFTFGQRIGIDCYDTVFEKADEEIKGAYNLVNQQFALYLKEKYSELKFINRESDLEIPGLRKAKLSYSPTEIFEKFRAILKD